jgi:hypothetical protein
LNTNSDGLRDDWRYDGSSERNSAEDEIPDEDVKLMFILSEEEEE